MNADTLLQHRIHNWFQSVLLLGGMGLLLALLGWLIAGAPGMVWAAVLGLGLLLFAPRMSPQLILRMYGAAPLSPREAPELTGLVDELAGRAGLAHRPRVYYIPSRVMNAFTVGNRDEAAIAVTDGLLRNLSFRELAGVLAHELSHVRNNDMWVMSLADLVSRLTHLLSLTGQLLVLLNLPLILLTDASISWLAILILVFAPTLSALLQLALSRSREFNADLGAAELTGDPRGLASALATLEQVQGGLIERILMPGRRNPDPSMLRTHPRTEERVQRLLELAADQPRGSSGFRHPPTHVAPPRIPAIRYPPRRRHISGLWH